MKKSLSSPTFAILPLLLACACSGAQAEGPIYRCGNEYTNKVTDAQKSHCKLIEGGNVTVVNGFKPPVAAAPSSSVRVATAGPAGARVDAAEQKARDSDARLILEAELKKAEARQNDLMAEYNNGQPDKRGDEARNYQKYLDRVAELKASLARNESDIAGIRRELGRVSAVK